uniref:Ig-like domain-containing protein n=1 Tax=Loxodonta africana TaxID=9785 RepID=G3UGR7_LOXAF
TNMLSTISILAIFLLFGGTNGDSVTQTEGPVTLSEGAPTILNCTYQSSYTTSLFWYVQYLNKAPQLLLKSSTETENQGFQANLVKRENSFHLQKRSIQISDSALYYCVMTDTVRRTAGGAEHKP